jgi:hypothetical protein
MPLLEKAGVITGAPAASPFQKRVRWPATLPFLRCGRLDRTAGWHQEQRLVASRARMPARLSRSAGTSASGARVDRRISFVYA